MALLCTYIFEKSMHTAPKKLHLPFQRQQTWRVGYLRLIYCTAMLQFYQFQVHAHLHNHLLLAWNKWTEICANVDVEMMCLEAREEFKHIFSLCWFASELLPVFIFLLISFAENLQYQRFCLVLILTSNVLCFQVGFFFASSPLFDQKVYLHPKK